MGTFIKQPPPYNDHLSVFGNREVLFRNMSDDMAKLYMYNCTSVHVIHLVSDCPLKEIVFLK